ncbi:MAG TPA: CGNR zinc finger domain-containing protein [Amycolatopsis sp.]|nr:CGNR zinc finger domain-containing protein [Amycolatopsis sp.]
MAARALSFVARVAGEILGGPEACTQVHLDTSCGSRRECCAIATGGNKMKALAHQARRAVIRR